MLLLLLMVRSECAAAGEQGYVHVHTHTTDTRTDLCAEGSDHLLRHPPPHLAIRVPLRISPAAAGSHDKLHHVGRQRLSVAVWELQRQREGLDGGLEQGGGAWMDGPGC